MIYILVDYDNLYPSDKERGVVFWIPQILRKVFANNDLINKLQAQISPQQASVRIYGGWRNKDGYFTHLAEDLHKDIQQLSLPYPSQEVNINVNVELASSLIIPNSGVFHHTLRTRSCIDDKMKIADPPQQNNCNISSCILHDIKYIMQTNNCRHGVCYLREIFTRDEQKLVDVMIACDVAYLSQNADAILVIVSDDNDFIPAIQLGLVYSNNIFMLHTKPHETVPAHYKRRIRNCVEINY